MDKNFFALDMELGTGRIQEVGICFWQNNTIQIELFMGIFILLHLPVNS